MKRVMYEPTNKIASRNSVHDMTIPSDDYFKDLAKKRRKPWGIVKRDYIVGAMAGKREYQIGLWQGRVDKARGLDYSEERNENAYNLGYYRGYTEYESNRGGWDAETRRRFDEKYLSDLEVAS